MVKLRRCRTSRDKRAVMGALAAAFCIGLCTGCGSSEKERESAPVLQEERLGRTGWTERTGQTEPMERTGRMEQTEQPETEPLSVRIGMSDMAAGDEVRLPVELVHNDGFSGFFLEISYDNAALGFETVELDERICKYQGLMECTEVPGSNLVRVSYICAQEVTGTGRLALVCFHRKAGVKNGTAAVEVRIDGIARLDGQKASGNAECVQILSEE